MAANTQYGLEHTIFDTASSAHFRIGLTKPPIKEFKAAKQTIKTSMLRYIGDMDPTAETPGIAEYSEGSMMLTVGVFGAVIAPRVPRHGGVLIEVPITTTFSHPAVKGEVAFLYDHVRIKTFQPPSLDGTEKEALVELGYSCRNIWFRAGTGKWQCLSLRQDLPASDAARALMSF